MVRRIIRGRPVTVIAGRSGGHSAGAPTDGRGPGRMRADRSVCHVTIRVHPSHLRAPTRPAVDGF
ncbi:MAG: hypothetical protein RMJ48_00025 [Roseiflexaceae bacterium]|nr:hypothetical protein [Roseiflexaceae bacterium]